MLNHCPPWFYTTWIELSMTTNDWKSFDHKNKFVKTNKNLIKNNLELHKKLPPSNSFTIIWNTYVIFGHFNSQWYSTCPSSPSYCKLSPTVLYFFFLDKIIKIFRIPIHPLWSRCKSTLNMEPPSPFYKSLAYRNLSVITQNFYQLKVNYSVLLRIL